MERKYLEIDLKALAHNYRVLADLAGPGTKMVSVVKADAYGHGLKQAARTLVDCGTYALGVFDPADAAVIRQEGIKVPIVSLSGIFPWEAGDAAKNNIDAVIFSMEAAQALSQAFLEKGETGNVIIKVDTGMGRLGIFPEDLPAFVEALAPLKGIRVTGIASHLAASEIPDHPHTKSQVEAFKRASLSMINDTLANSGAVLEGLAKGVPLARPGIALYGSAPDPGMKGADLLKPVMTFKTLIISLKTLPQGSPISYGMTFTTSRPSLIAAVPVGYADGYFRRLANKGAAIVHGKRVPVVGTVCMNLTMLDVTGIDNVQPGDEVVLLGEKDGLRVTGDELAASAGTISYEIYCSLGHANPRQYKE
ncbi:alanine racemase [Desulfatibacillum alkenivorans DSM 16219]|jgi:alanine racemase|uniref:Alanine racemase n=1 Tax=Desulfatibacillum alkenivorans DSM 16219 TaxID=1121393 RepID=A0A1M6M967_9BACT|nr:alanine racemase [Desulfatibacillum alkenivorans]SHJ79823.1 alanine racemase [Desulfatibacillum alkenivorans DSM 16219]